MDVPSKLLLATNNPGKIRELAVLLQDTPFVVTTPNEEGIVLEVEETGTTFEENATLKAEAFAKASGLCTLADDSGIEVDALGGEPGVYSARYAGPGAARRTQASASGPSPTIQRGPGGSPLRRRSTARSQRCGPGHARGVQSSVEGSSLPGSASATTAEPPGAARRWSGAPAGPESRAVSG